MFKLSFLAVNETVRRGGQVAGGGAGAALSPSRRGGAPARAVPPGGFRSPMGPPRGGRRAAASPPLRPPAGNPATGPAPAPFDVWSREKKKVFLVIYYGKLKHSLMFLLQ